MVEHTGTKYPLSSVLPHISSEVDRRLPRVDFDGDPIRVSSLRMVTFKVKGTDCVRCGKKGAYFRKTRSSTDVPWHFNLYAADGTLMTKDHIIPKSKGGKDFLHNMQTMCTHCNRAKGSGK